MFTEPTDAHVIRDTINTESSTLRWVHNGLKAERVVNWVLERLVSCHARCSQPKGKSRAEEMVLSFKCLLHKHKDMSSIPGTHGKGLGVVAST